MPMPPPMHKVARPFLALRRPISCSSVTSTRAPESLTWRASSRLMEMSGVVLTEATVYRTASNSACPVTGLCACVKLHSPARGGVQIGRSVRGTLQMLPSIDCVWLISSLP